MSKENQRTIKTYMQFALPVDPADVKTLVDLDLSYALAMTLVSWSPNRELVSGLAESWAPVSDKSIRFNIGKNMKWSDGSDLTAQNVVASLVRAKKLHGESLKSLYDCVESIEAMDSKTVLFKLNTEVTTSGVIKKLTEPMYGIVFVKQDGTIDMSKTTGPFKLKAATDKQLGLVANSNFVGKASNMAEAVQIRRPPAGEEIQASFLSDEWANLFSSSSLIPEAIRQKFVQKHYEIWNRNLDKIFFIAPGPRLVNDGGRKLFQLFNQKIERSKVTKGLSGFAEAEQFFPSGYVLFDPEFKKTKEDIKLPEQFGKRPLEILAADTRTAPVLQQNIKDVLKAITGVEPKFKLVSLSEFEKARTAGQYDILAGALPVNDPNIEGAMAFFFGLTPPIIPNAGEGSKDFQKRVAAVRKQPDQAIRNLEYRRVFTEAALSGSLLPLFHYSTIVIAKEGLDLSQVPTTDESVAFAKVRFK